MADDETVEGLPSPYFLPLAKYKFKQSKGMASVTIPLRGSYPEGGPISGEYDISPEPGAILFGTLTQALLGMGKYPTLTDTERFIISGLEIDGQNITIIGRIVEILEAKYGA